MSPILQKLLDKYNLALNVAKILEELELAPEPQAQKPDYVIAHCPLHDEPHNRSLEINAAENTYRCMGEHCPGHAGGNLIRLYALTRRLSYEDAGLQIFNVLGLETTEETRVLKRNLYIAFSEKLTTEELEQASKNMLLSAFKEFPRNLVIISRLINVYTREGNKKKACDYLLQAASIVADNRNYDGARTALKRIFSVDPENEKAKKLLDDIFVAEWTDFYESRTAPQGENSLLDSLKDVSISPSLRLKLTETLLKHNRRKMLEGLYSDIPEDLDDDQRAHLETVAHKLKKRISRYQDSVSPLLHLSDILLKLGNYEPAKEALTGAQKAIEAGASAELKTEIENRLENFESLLVKKEYQYAIALMQAGNYEAAQVSLERVKNAREPTPQILEKLIHCYFKLGDNSGALARCLEMADVLNAEGKHQEAALALSHALLFSPGNHQTTLKLIETYKQLGNSDLAEQVADLAERQFHVQPQPPKEKKISPPPQPPPLPTPAPAQYEIRLPFTLKLYTTSAATDRLPPIEAETVSISQTHVVVDCGALKLSGIQPASINYVLQNCQIMAYIHLPEYEEPARLFGQITKIQNRRVNETFYKIVTIDLLESDDPTKQLYDEFLRKLAKGYVPPTPAKTTKPTRALPQGKISKELLVSTRFLDDAGEEKSPDFFYANTTDISVDELTLNFGELKISGVQAASLNYFLKNSVLEMTVPLPEPNVTVRLLGHAKSVRNKATRGKQNKILKVEFANSPLRDKKIYEDYIREISAKSQ